MSSPKKRLLIRATACAALISMQAPMLAQPPQTSDPASPPAAPLPPEAETALFKAVMNVKRNFKAFERENEKPLEDAYKTLAKLVTRLNNQKEGEKASAVQGLINNLKDVVLERAGAVDLPPAAAAVPLLQKLQGRWSHPNYHLLYQFGADGTFTETVVKTGQQNIGTAKDIGDGVVHVDVNRHHLEILMAGDDRIAVLVWDPDKKPLFYGLALSREQPIAQQAPAPATTTPKPGD